MRSDHPLPGGIIIKGFIILAVLLLLLPSIASAAADEAVGTVSNVVDGDTIDVQLPSEEIRVRLADVDAPEMSTDEGPVAKQYTTQWLNGKTVSLDLDGKTGKDAYGRWVAVVYLETSDGTLENFNKMLVDAGQACIWDFDNNEFTPADWWDGYIPADACIKGDNSGASEPAISQTSSTESAESDGTFVGSVKSDKYHYPSCKWAKKIKSSNEIWFDGSAEARAAGYSPCSVCNPP